MQYKKGQAAMEFLMTYGWAILAAIIAIGVLAYFGVFNPGRLAGPAGLVSPPFNLDDFNIVDGGAGSDVVTMVVTQNLGSSLNLLNTPAVGLGAITEGYIFKLPTGVYCNLVSTTPNAIIVSPTGSSANGIWTSGTQVTVTATCPAASWGVGDAVRADLT